MTSYPRVKRIIRDTFLSMMAKKGFHNISVKDILEAADVSKSGFYSHFEDKYALLKFIEDEFLEDLRTVFAEVRSASNGKPLTSKDPQAASYYAKYFEYIGNHEDLFILLLSKKGGGNFINRLSNLVEEEQKKTREAWGTANIIPEKLINFYTSATSYAYIGLFLRWCSSDHATRPTPLEMGAGLAEFFRHDNLSF